LPIQRQGGHREAQEVIRQGVDENLDTLLSAAWRKVLFAAAMRHRQQDSIARSRRVAKAAVAAWPASRRLWNSLIATLGPVR
jgi:hypothetical protein